MAWSKKHQTSDTTKGLSDGEKKSRRIKDAQTARNIKVVKSNFKDSGQGKGKR